MKKQTIKLNESQLRKMIKEALNEIRPKKQPKTGKIQNKEGKWIDATEDGQDKYGNPMYRTKDSSITYGRKCKDGGRRVQDFNFRPNVNESKLSKIIKGSIKKVLNEENEETFESIVFKKAFDIRAFVRSIQHAMSGLEQCARQMDAKEGATAHYLTQVVNDVRFSLEKIENDAIELKNARADVIRRQK